MVCKSTLNFFKKRVFVEGLSCAARWLEKLVNKATSRRNQTSGYTTDNGGGFDKSGKVSLLKHRLS